MEFQQLDWLSDSGGYNSLNSDFGRASVLFSPADIGSFNFNPGDGSYYGYLNVVTTVSGGTPNNWAVQNLPLRFDSAASFGGRLADSVWFDLTISSGTDVSSLFYDLNVSPVPLASPGFSATLLSTVANSDVLFGGLDGTTGFDTFTGGTGQSAPPDAQNYIGAAVGNAIGAGGAVSGSLTNIPAVNEATNACAPGSAARSLVYLRNQTGVAVTGTPQQIYGQLTNAMNTTVAGGTSVSNFLAGKRAYTTTNGLPITTIQSNSIPAALQALRSTNDVEVMIWWGRNGAGASMGGHAAMVTGLIPITNAAGQITGYTMTYIDDSIQGDGIASNNMNTLQIGTNGTFAGFGTGAQLIGFQIETSLVPEPSILTFAMVVGAAAAAVRNRRSKQTQL